MRGVLNKVGLVVIALCLYVVLPAELGAQTQPQRNDQLNNDIKEMQRDIQQRSREIEQRALNQHKVQLHEILTTAFPSVRLVIDAPLQMQREVDTLQRNAGRVTSTDFEPMLATAASALPDGVLPTQWHFAKHVLRAQGLSLNDAQASTAQTNLKAQHLQLRREGNDAWVIQPEATP